MTIAQPAAPWFAEELLDAADSATTAALSPPGDPFDVVAVRDVVEQWAAQRGTSRLVDLTVALALSRAENLEAFARFGGAPEDEVADAIREWLSEAR